MRRVAGAVIAALVSAACAGHVSQPPARGTRTPARAGTPAVHRLPRLRLVADVDEKPGSWTHLASVSYGAGEDELAYAASDESGPVSPSSFAVAGDGSLWIVDPGNRRVAHFSAGGEFLGSAGPIAAEALDATIRGASVLVVEGMTGPVAVVDASGARSSIRRAELTSPVPIAVVGVVQRAAGDPSPDVFAVGVSYADPPEPAPAPYAAIAVGSGPLATYRFVDGIPATERTTVDPRVAAGGDGLEVSFATGTSTAVRPIGISLESHGHVLTSVISIGSFVALGSMVVMDFAVAEADPSGDVGQGGHWLLGVGPGPEPLLWERLHEPSRPDDHQTRRLAVGPDGSLYEMVLGRDGVEIFRRR